MSIDTRKIIDNFERSHKDLTVTMLIDYDDKYYVIEAVPSLSETYYDDPFYAIEKKTSNIVNFSPAYDIDKFEEACDNRLLYAIDDTIGE